MSRLLSCPDYDHPVSIGSSLRAKQQHQQQESGACAERRKVTLTERRDNAIKDFFFFLKKPNCGSSILPRPACSRSSVTILCGGDAARRADALSSRLVRETCGGTSRCRACHHLWSRGEPLPPPCSAAGHMVQPHWPAARSSCTHHHHHHQQAAAGTTR